MSDSPSEALARMERGKKLYEERTWLWHLSCKLPLRDLKRLNGILRKLSDEDMKRVAAFAEGLAEWAAFAQEPSNG